MKKTLAVLLSFCMLFCLAACGTNKPEEELFIVGETLASPVGNNFKMPITGQIDKYATITNLKVTALKIADINDKSDYDSNEDQTVFKYYRYIYQLELSGKVDVSFAGKKISVNFAFDNNTIAEFYDKHHDVTINPDGTFSVNTRIGSNGVEKYIYPTILAINSQ